MLTVGLVLVAVVIARYLLEFFAAGDTEPDSIATLFYQQFDDGYREIACIEMYHAMDRALVRSLLHASGIPTAERHAHFAYVRVGVPISKYNTTEVLVLSGHLEEAVAIVADYWRRRVASVRVPRGSGVRAVIEFVIGQVVTPVGYAPEPWIRLERTSAVAGVFAAGDATETSSHATAPPTTSVAAPAGAWPHAGREEHEHYWPRVTIETLRASLAQNDVDARDPEWSMTALMAAAADADPGIVQYLIDAGAAVNAVDADGYTALMYAASLNPNPSIVSLLVDAGADLGARTVQGWTPLMEAASGSDNAEVVRELLRSGSEVDAVNAVGATALMLAARANGDTAIIDALLAAGARINATDLHGNSALLSAARESQSPAVVERLLDAGADPTLVNASGETALALARVNAALASTPLLDRLRFDS